MRVAVLLLVLCPAASADPTFFAHWMPVDNSTAPGADPFHPDFNDGRYVTYDLCVVSPDTTWETAIGSITIDHGEFFEHTQGGNGPIQDDMGGTLPALPYDCVWHGPWGQFLFSPDPVVTEPRFRFAGWADFGAEMFPPGTPAVVARVTVRFDVEGDAATLVYDGEFGFHGFVGRFPARVETRIPEPSSASLLAITLISRGLQRRPRLDQS